MAPNDAIELEAAGTLGQLEPDDAEPALPGGRWYVAADVDAGLRWNVPPGALGREKWLSMDLLLDGRHAAVFSLCLREGDDGPTFEARFGLLNQCQARLRLSLALTDNNRWLIGRQGALLKLCCGGRRVDPAKVGRVTLRLARKPPGRVRWCQTSLRLTGDEPPRLDEPLLPAGPLLDELGQSTLHDWPGKTPGPAELATRLQTQLADTPRQRWPDGFSRWGGWQEKRFDATGFFRARHDGRRWWLVDPDGCAFWSAGIDCMGPSIDAACGGLAAALSWTPPENGDLAEAHLSGAGGARGVNYLAANFLRAFGPTRWRDAWGRIALAELRRCGFNTVGNWSEWSVPAAAGFPYVRPLSPSFPRTPAVFRDFPDVFADSFEADADDYARQLADTADDPALVGYFLMNEPTWGFAAETPAEGMLFNTDRCVARDRLVEHLRRQYGTDEALAAAWGMEVTFEGLAAGRWRRPLTDAARADLAAFSTVMVDRLFGGLSAACRKVDPNHLNLGARYYTLPPEWALAGMDHFDVFSINGYDLEPPADRLLPASERLGKPLLIGEWHFGALDAGLPASGIGHVADQAARGQAYRVYLEAGAALPCLVGVHYFQFYDQSALGRSDGENYNIGLLDVCNRPYEELAGAARASHERMYRVADGQTPPYADKPEYLPKLFY